MPAKKKPTAKQVAPKAAPKAPKASGGPRQRKSSGKASASAVEQPVAVPASPVGDGSLMELNEVSTGEGVLRSLKRSATDEAVQRIMRLKVMPIVGNQDVEGIANENGEKLRDVLAAKVLECRGSQHITQKWLHETFESFGLVKTAAKELPAPPEGESVPTQLLEALGVLCNDNPAKRSPDVILQYFEIAEELNYTSWFVLLNAIQESRKVLRASSVRLQVAALCHMARLLVGVVKPSCCNSVFR